MEDKKNTIVEHLDELRVYIVRSLIFLFICVVIIYNFVGNILKVLIKPVGKLVFIAPQEAFVANIKLAFSAGLLVSSPFILYQIWRFVSSGLSAAERKQVCIFGPFSFLLFIVGFIFGYALIVPLGVKFLLGFSSDYVAPMITISNYISFVSMLSFAFALVFQLPMVLLFLTKIGIVTPEVLVKRRKEAVVLVFISAATLTPPDVITQVLMAIPLILLYELGVILSKLAYRASLQKDA
jgi:sec-independent protein translocase protein TatC